MLNNAYARRTEGRWYIFIWTPAGHIVRLLVSYPDKAAAVAAIRLLGYAEVCPPNESETVADERGRVPS